MELAEKMKLKFSRDLLKKRELYLLGEVNLDETDRMLASILWLNARSDKDIKFYINSAGGEALAGLAMYDAVRFSNAPINGIVIGKANSMAFVVLQACAKRQAMKHACFFLHTLNTKKSLFELSEKKIKESLRKSLESQKAIFKIFSARSGMEINKIRKLCEETSALSAKEAKELNLIDEII